MILIELTRQRGDVSASSPAAPRWKALIAALLGFVLLAAPTDLQAADQSGQPLWTTVVLDSQPGSRAKRDPVIAERAGEYLLKQNSDVALVWVFFTDKRCADQVSFERKAAAVRLTERALKRRAKVGRDHVVNADLPVPVEYVEAVTQLGAVHRRSSRWLNASSFAVPAQMLQRIAALPFVAEIRPVARFGPSIDDVSEARPAPPDETALAPAALDYGSSYTQLQQLQVPAAHEQGYSGLGVTLTITDTGFRKSHQAFAQHFADSRVLAEYDFVFNDTETANEPEDATSAWNHGTSVWSIAGGSDDGTMYGPAYRANFILCKTEDIRSETPVEEDNWVAALEFADSVGTDVITTSLGYSDWYTYSDFDGQTAVISIAAGTCDGLGIVMCNSMGNAGPALSTLTAPADAFDILSVGSVSSTGTIASSSSRGPTADGRIKPDLCAMGLNTYIALGTGDALYGTGSGTSFATPLIAGAACLLIEAHPDWRPSQVREALAATGNHASAPDNIYGWGIPNVDSALALNPDCCVGRVGNVNALGGDAPTIGDVMTLIDHLYISLTPLDCYPEADIDLSGFVWPDAADITVGDVSMLIDHMFITRDTLFNCFSEYESR